MEKFQEIVGSPNVAKLVEDNIKYVYYVLKRFKIPRGEVEEFARIGKYGLLKAAMTFDATKGFKFLAYAEPCIQNEIGMEFRKRKVYKQYVVVSIEDLSQAQIEYVMVDRKTSNYEERLMAREIIGDIISAIVNCLPYRKKMIMLLAIASWGQEEIAQIVRMTQSYVSREIKRCRAKFEEYLEEYYDKRKKGKELFHVVMDGGAIKISFPTEKVVDLEQVLDKVFLQVGEKIEAENFTITSSKTGITIEMPAEAKYLAFIAFLAKEIEGDKEITAEKS